MTDADNPEVAESHKSRLLARIAQAKVGSNISEDFWREMEALADRIVVQDLDGRTIKFDKVAEAEAALAEVEAAYERLDARVHDAIELLTELKGQFSHVDEALRILRGTS